MVEDIRANYYPKLLRRTLIQHEGFRSYVYLDTRGFPTGGIGHKLTPAENKIYKLKQALPTALTDSWFDADVAEAEKGAKRLVASFDSLPVKARVVLVDMVFNMGAEGLSKFHNFLDAVQKQDWSRAITEMKNSLWYAQTKTRADDDIRLIMSINGK